MRSPLLGQLVAPLALSLATSVTAGCSANVATPVELADAEATSSSSMAVVVVERTTAAADSARAEAIARVLRMRSGAVDEQALRMVGATVDVPALGTCATLSALSAISAAPSTRNVRIPRAIELVDVGNVTLETNGVATSLPARRLPDVADLVSGVVYARAVDADAMPSRGRYELKIAGAGDIAPFAMAGFAPGEPGELRVAGKDARLAGSVTLVHGAGAEIDWEAGSTDDFVYVDVVGGSGSITAGASGSSVRCAFADNGHAVLGPSAFGALEEGTLSIHRVHREPFRARGVDAGELRFDFARAVPFARR